MAIRRRRGRPARSHERATRRLDLRLTPTEWRALEEFACGSGRSMAAAARLILMSHTASYAEIVLEIPDDDDESPRVSGRGERR